MMLNIFVDIIEQSILSSGIFLEKVINETLIFMTIMVRKKIGEKNRTPHKRLYLDKERTNSPTNNERTRGSDLFGCEKNEAPFAFQFSTSAVRPMPFLCPF